MAETDYTRQLEEIKSAGKKRDYQRAISLCTELLAQTDQYPDALLYLGRSCHALKLFDRALYAFQFFLKRKPQSPAGRFFIGRTYLALGLYQRAIFNLKKALQRAPGFAPALSFLGLAYLKRRRPDKAIPYLERALKAEPKNQRVHNAYLNALLVQAVRLFYRQDNEGAARIFEFLVRERPDSLLPRLYLAVIARELGNYTESLRYYDAAQKISPGDPVFHLHKAYLLLTLKRDREGWSELAKAKGLLPEDFNGLREPNDVLKAIAVTHFRNKRYREAIYFGKQILKNNYQDAPMHMLMAECYRYYGDLDKAKNHYTRAVETEKTRPEIFSGLAVVLWETGDYRELLALTRGWRNHLPADPLIAYFQALALSELGTAPEELIPLLREQIHKHGPDPELMFSLGRTYAAGGLFELAENWLLKTVKLIADHEEALLLLDRVYEQLRKTDEQIGVLKTYCAVVPDDYEILKKCVRLLLQASRFAEAAGGLEKLVTREPGNRSLRKALGLVHIKNKKFIDAFLVFRELVAREPTSRFYLRQLIFCLAKMRKFKIAILILDKASRFMKNDISLLLPLGVLYARAGQFEKAGVIFREVLGINAREWRAYHNLAMLARRMGNKSLAESLLERARELKGSGSEKKTNK